MVNPTDILLLSHDGRPAPAVVGLMTPLRRGKHPRGEKRREEGGVHTINCVALDDSERPDRKAQYISDGTSLQPTMSKGSNNLRGESLSDEVR